MSYRQILASRSWPIVAVLVCMTGLQVSVAGFSLYLLSAVRAYVAGESLYSKGQKDAQIYLLDYAQNRLESDYQNLSRALSVPLADRRAREELQKGKPNLEVARQAFIEGGNHPDDVAGMIRLFRWFGDTPLMSKAVATWTEGDRVIEKVQGLVERTRHRVLAGQTDSEALRQIRSEAPALNARLTELEREFSDQLGQAARQAQSLLLALNGLLAVVLTVSSIAFVRRTERTQATTEAEVVRGQFLMERLVGAVTDGVITFGDDLRILVFNAAAERLFLVSALDALGSPISRFLEGGLPSTGQVEDGLPGALYELTGRRTDRSAFHLEASFSRVQMDDGVLNTVVLRDVTARELARAEQQAREALEATSRAKTEFLSRMSHELRTPLNAVIGFSRLLRVDALHPPTSQQLKRIQHIEKAGAHLLALVDDVLDLSRIESGGMAVKVEAVELSAAIEEATTMVSPLVTRTDIELVVAHSVMESSPKIAAHVVRVHADPLRLRQVLVNLLSNAVKYNRPGGSVSVSWRVIGDRCQISIADTGLGMPPDKVNQLFQPFNRLGAEASKIEGAGIGLVLSRRLTEMMGGELTISSTVGEGTVATIVLEVATPAAVRDEAPVLPSQHKEIPSELDVLYAEDNEVNAELVRQIISLRPAVTLRIAEDGRAALQMARARAPDLMLIDMNLGDMTGLELARALRGSPETRDVELVALSADALPEQIDTAMKCGFRDYLTKPVNFGKLLHLLDARL